MNDSRRRGWVSRRRNVTEEAFFEKVGDESPQEERKSKNFTRQEVSSRLAGFRRDITDEGRNGGREEVGK